LREMECSPRGLTSIFKSLDMISPVAAALEAGIKG
jgi:hypothetical protein